MLVGRLRERAGLLSHFLFYPRCCVNLSFLSFPSNLLEHRFLLFLGLSLTKEQRGEIIELVLEGKKTERRIAYLMGIPKSTVHDVLHQSKTGHTLDRHIGRPQPRAQGPSPAEVA